MFKTEPHLHTLEGSNCALIRAVEMIRLYHKAGYKTVFITDHLNDVNIDIYGDIPWEMKTTAFLSGYYKSKQEGQRLKMNVLPAAEISCVDNPNHYLLYGISKEFLDEYPNIHKKTIAEIREIARKNNIFMVQAHPFRDGKCYPTPEYVDAFEIYNENPRHDNFTKKAEEFAKNSNIYITCGSDAHRLEDIGVGGVESEQEIKTVQQYINLIKSGKGRIIRTQET
ncbi:MAG: PHP-associated domain-containing protein [Acutalibacteraceae bacterium]|jgi:predicted metal-dependent phosphoesterase TrpH